MSEYYEFKNIFLPSTIYESQIPLQKTNSHISTPVYTEDSESNGPTIDSISPVNSDCDTEPFESIETIYQVSGIIKDISAWYEPDWWVVDINEPEQIEKIARPGLTKISGLFKNVGSNSLCIGSKVLVELTYKNNGGCLWKKNKIINLIE